jgi:hypothetical protein
VLELPGAKSEAGKREARASDQGERTAYTRYDINGIQSPRNPDTHKFVANRGNPGIRNPDT